MKGHLILLVGTPGGGKSLLLEYVRETFPRLHFAVSCTSRAQRPGELEGRNYFFISKEEFQTRIKADTFLEWIEQDGGNFYGTLKSEILEPLERGDIVVREVEMRGVRAIKKLVPAHNLTVIFIEADEWDVLQRRIKERAPISEAELLKRKERYERERLFIPEADIVVQNYDGELDEAKRQLKASVAQVINTMWHNDAK